VQARPVIPLAAKIRDPTQIDTPHSYRPVRHRKSAREQSIALRALRFELFTQMRLLVQHSPIETAPRFELQPEMR
jgi:hypothetical protein